MTLRQDSHEGPALRGKAAAAAWSDSESRACLRLVQRPQVAEPESLSKSCQPGLDSKSDQWATFRPSPIWDQKLNVEDFSGQGPGQGRGSAMVRVKYWSLSLNSAWTVKLNHWQAHFQLACSQSRRVSRVDRLALFWLYLYLILILFTHILTLLDHISTIFVLILGQISPQ